MAVFSWTTLNNNQTIAFNPNIDVLNVNDPNLSAADVGTSGGSSTASISISIGGKTVTLQTDRRALTTSNVSFADGSVRFLTSDIPAETLRGALTRNGKEKLSIP